MADKKKKKPVEKKQSKVSEKKDVVHRKEIELPPLPSNLTEEQLVEFREAFELFNEAEEPRIPATSVVTLMRKLGLMPSNKDVEEIIEQMDTDGSIGYDGLAFEHFCCVAAKKVHEVYTESDVIAAFKVFDKNDTGYLSTTEIKRILQEMGEPLNAEEMDALIDNTTPDAQDNVKYADFVKEMLSEF